MVRRGWFGNSYGHKLSAMGVSTKKYVPLKKRKQKYTPRKGDLLFKNDGKMFFAEKEKKGIVDALTEQPSGQLAFKQGQEERIVGSARDRVMDAVESGEIRSGDANRIMRDVDAEAEMFRTSTSGQMDYEMFKDNVERIVRSGLRQGNTSLRIFDYE